MEDNNLISINNEIKKHRDIVTDIKESKYQNKAKIKQLIDSIIETSYNEYEYSFYFANNQVNLFIKFFSNYLIFYIFVIY